MWISGKMRLDDIWRGRSLRIAIGVAVLAVVLVTDGADAKTLTVDDDSGDADYTMAQMEVLS